MKPPLISCIIPVYNGEQFLREAIDSIMAQSYRSVEVIVVDDGSTDGTATVVRSYGDKINYLWQTNSGPAAARNLGMSFAKGEYIAFLDADDLWYPEKLATQMARFKACSEIELCLTHLKTFQMRKPSVSSLSDEDLVTVITPYTLSSVLVRRSLIDKLGKFNEYVLLGEDTDWFTRATNQGTVIEIIPEPLVYKRLHSNNLTRDFNTVSKYELLQRVKNALDQKRCRDEKIRLSKKLNSKIENE
jgi:glycosyltransferase involved in cell wall biosynthesis